MSIQELRAWKHELKSRSKSLNPRSDDDDDYDDDELFLWYGWLTKGVSPYFQPGLLSEILTIANLQHAASRVWTCAEPEFRLSWMKLCSSDKHYNTAPVTSSTFQVTSSNPRVIRAQIHKLKNYLINKNLSKQP